MVETYTLSNLTYQRDILVAFSGVAKWFQRRKADDDFAGMWKLDLEEQLCWKRSQDSYQDHKDYIAPTWSWASVNLPVKFLSIHDKAMLSAKAQGFLYIHTRTIFDGIVENKGVVIAPNQSDVICFENINIVWDTTFLPEKEKLVYSLPILGGNLYMFKNIGLVLELSNHHNIPWLKSTDQYQRIGFFHGEWSFQGCAVDYPNPQDTDKEVMKGDEKLRKLTIV
ncbi:hypothetical protein B0J14DRAFT_565425 [Halenospora varia]|nr:hypothetical protein B0J14DRAFT_565425 [Halenospora varia]